MSLIPEMMEEHGKNPHSSLTRADVQCYSGYRGEERPTSFVVWERRVEVVEILDQWLAPDYRYFKLKGSDGAIYILRHDQQTQQWEISFYSKLTEGYEKR